MLYYFLKSLAIGLAIAAPVGPIGVLCIRESLTRGFRSGLSCGMGAAAADGTYGAIAAFGLVSLDKLTGGLGPWTGLLGGLFLFWLGWKILRSEPSGVMIPADRKHMARGFLTTYLLTLSNPATILSFVAIFAGLGITLADGWTGKSVTVAGVFLGSALWWIILAGFSARLRERISSHVLKRINLISALIILVMACAALYTAWRGFKA